MEIELNFPGLFDKEPGRVIGWVTVAPGSVPCIAVPAGNRVQRQKARRGRQVDLKIYRLDLHVHTVLSPCTEIAEMTPRAIVRTALDRGLDMIAVCDHNSARNTAATRRAAEGSGLTVIPGIEITSSEEVHILGLFPTESDAEAVQEEVYARLFGQNDERGVRLPGGGRRIRSSRRPRSKAPHRSNDAER